MSLFYNHKQRTPEYARTVEKRRDQVDAARDEWWMLEIEALRSEMKETVDEVKTRNNDVLEILKVVRGVQESINQVSARVANPPSLVQPAPSLPTSESFRTNILSPNSQCTKVATPVQTMQPLPSNQHPPKESQPTHTCSGDSLPVQPESSIGAAPQQVVDTVFPLPVPATGLDCRAEAQNPLLGSGDCNTNCPKKRARKRVVSPPRPRRLHAMVPTPLPRLSPHPIPYSTPVMILHPQYERPVAYGKAGPSWKTKTGKLGPLCQPGQQMVQINLVTIPNVPLMHLESRHFAKTLEGALTPIPMPTGQKVFYVKWDTSHLIKN